MQLVVDEYIRTSDDASFEFIPAWNHVPLFEMLDFLFWPADAENIILKQLSLIKMKPISSVFTRLSWDAYNLYYQDFCLFLINNKNSLVNVKEKRINNIFM